jgi:hypothetical protein
MTEGDLAIDRTDLVGQNRQLVADLDVIDGNVFEGAPPHAVCDGRHAARQGSQRCGRAAYGQLLQRLAAREHQHHDCTRQVLSEKRRRHNRDTGELIRTESPMSGMPHEFRHEQHAANAQHREQRDVRRRKAVAAIFEDEVQKDARERKGGVDEVAPTPQARRQRYGWLSARREVTRRIESDRGHTVPQSD